MLNPFIKIISIYRFQIIVAILTILTIVFILLFLNSNFDSKFGIITGGIGAGLIVAIIQYLFSLQEFKAFSNIKKLDIKKILPSRDEEYFYSSLIKNANMEIKVMGVTAFRMMEDFADETSPREDKKVLLSSLSKGVSVKLLLPQKDFLSDPRDQIKHDQSKEIFNKLKNKFKTFEVKYFKHIPTQSIFLVDQNCILGPVLSNFASKDTPCIYMGVNNDFAKKYIEYFDKEWNNIK